MRKIWLGLLSVVFVYGCSNSDFSAQSDSALPPGITLVEEMKADPDRVMIPYSKYKLDNGLTVILAPDDSDPLVHVDVTYHVGSAREEIGKSGFAHFFEHMMFQGSEHVGDQQHFKIITEAGGTLNGTTTRDRTNYFETVPSNQLEKCCGWKRTVWAFCLALSRSVSLKFSAIPSKMNAPKTLITALTV